MIRYNIFPTLVYVLNLSDLIEPVKDLMKSVTWKDEVNGGQSKNVHILDSNKILLKQFENKVNDTLSEIQYDVPLQLTTSWFTKTKPYGRIGMHTHTNSMWSSVYYFDDDCGYLSFTKDAPQINVDFQNKDHNLQMFGDVKFPASKGSMILFPSSLTHHLDVNDFDKYRYSFAMNFMPIGLCRHADSTYEYK